MAEGEALGAPAASGAVSNAPVAGEPELRHSEPADTPIVVAVPFTPRPCAVCYQPLGATERKVHRAGCARMRKTQLQCRRRRRSRSW